MEAKLKGDVAHTLRFLPNVLGFLGGLDEPTPVPQRDINRMLGSAEETEFEENLDCPYLVNDTVKVMEGPFSGFSGIVEEVNAEKHKPVSYTHLDVYKRQGWYCCRYNEIGCFMD